LTPQDFVRAARCPQCRAPLSTSDETLVCTSTPSHIVRREDGVYLFAEPPAGKYDPAYAARYAALWAFGYQTLHKGLNEGLYRTASSFIAEALAEADHAEPLIVDAGCGVGRVLADAALLARRGLVAAFDASPSMLEFARRVVVGGQPMDVPLPTFGFPSLRIAGVGTSNVVLGRADVEDLPLADGCADVVLSVNIVDRLPHGPEVAFRECHRVLRPGGTLVFTDPFNWIEPWLWEKYPDSRSVLALLEATGFALDTWFDDLFYRELIDARGSFDEFRTLAVKAHKK
jgi:SAM-dependent methyltransferase